MVAKKIERNTVFLYPTAKREDIESFINISRLVTDLKSIIRVANDCIEKLLCDTCFSSVKCIPSVTMRCISENSIKIDDCKNVRICIINYNNEDYTENYSEIVTAYKNGSSDISHLIALHINKDSKVVKFSKDKNKNFDAIVETGLEFLDKLLISIMLDISIYHYFCLSNLLTERKQFNKIKYNYLYETYKLNKTPNIYGKSFKINENIYLPFSLSNIIELFNLKEIDSEKRNIEKLINEFATFIMNSMEEKVFVTNKGTISKPYSHTKSTFGQLEKYLKDNKDNLQLPFKIIIPHQNTTIKLQPLIIYYDVECGELDNWVNKLDSDIDGYDIYSIEEKI